MNETQPLKLTDANFDAEVMRSDVPVLVACLVTDCATCRAVARSIEPLSSQYAATAKIGILNLDENPRTITRFGVSSIPLVLFFRCGRVVDSLVGVRPRERYALALDQALATSSDSELSA